MPELVTEEIRLRGELKGKALSLKQIQIIQFTADGLLSKEIAYKLHISERTVNFHLDNVYKKLEVQNKAHAVAECFRKGLIK